MLTMAYWSWSGHRAPGLRHTFSTLVYQTSNVLANLWIQYRALVSATNGGRWLARLARADTINPLAIDGRGMHELWVNSR